MNMKIVNILTIRHDFIANYVLRYSEKFSALTEKSL